MKKIISIFMLILLTASLSACGKQLTDELVREIAENESSLAGMNTSALHIESVVEFDNQIKDLPNSENNKLVLLSDEINNGFSIVAVDIENEKFNIWSTGYKPLNVLINDILTNESTEINIANFNLVADYIKKYGFNCLQEQFGQEERFKYAEEYIRELTGTGGILNTEVARGILDKTLPSYMFPNVNSEVAILYENGNANPLYYAEKSSEMVYNWSFFDEGTYNVWKATTDRQTQNTMIALYGQPYVPKTVWVVVDKYCEDEVGTFNSLEAAKKKLIPNSAPAPTKTPTSNTSNSNTKPVENNNSTPSKETEKNKEYSEKEQYYLDNYYRAKHILIFTEDLETGKKIENVEQKIDEVQARINIVLASGEDIKEAFDDFIEDYSEDPGCATNPNGYFFKDGEMVKEFENAVKSIGIGEVTTCESEYGYHFVLRLALDETPEIFEEGFKKSGLDA